MIRDILLLRHGEHDEVGRVLSGRSEIALNAAGCAQAHAAAAALSHAPLVAIHSSPRRRCRQTAEPIATRLPIEIAPALDEIDFSAFAGRSFAALERDPDWRRWNAERDRFRCPGGETMAEAIDRAALFLEDLSGGSPVLCVTHCDIIRGLVVRALDLPIDRIFALPCDPGSITRIAVDGDQLRLVTLNALPPTNNSFPRQVPNPAQD